MCSRKTTKIRRPGFRLLLALYNFGQMISISWAYSFMCFNPVILSKGRDPAVQAAHIPAAQGPCKALGYSFLDAQPPTRLWVTSPLLLSIGYKHIEVSHLMFPYSFWSLLSCIPFLYLYCHFHVILDENIGEYVFNLPNLTTRKLQRKLKEQKVKLHLYPKLQELHHESKREDRPSQETPWVQILASVSTRYMTLDKLPPKTSFLRLKIFFKRKKIHWKL